MAPLSPLKNDGNMRSRSRMPQRTKASLLLQKKPAVASTSKLPTTVPVAAPALAPYQSTPKRTSVPVKPSRVASFSTELLKKVTSQPLKHKLKGSPRAQQRPLHRKENQAPDLSSTSSQHNVELSPLSSQNPSKILQSQSDQHPSGSSNSPQTASAHAKETLASSPRARRHSLRLAVKALHLSSSGGHRRRSLRTITQLSAFVRPKDKAKPVIGFARRSSGGVSDDGPPASRSSAGDSDDTVISSNDSPGSPGSKAAKLSSGGRADSSMHKSPTSRRKSLRKSTAHPVASVINGTPGRQGGQALNTPFRSQAPKSAHRRSVVPQLSGPSVKHAPIQLILWKEQIKEWLYRPWKLCFMSALTGFEVQTQNLRTAYQNTLRQLISETVPFTLQVTIEPRHCFSRDPSKVDVVALFISYSVPVEWDVRQQHQTAAAAMATGDAALAAASSRHKKKKKEKKAGNAVKGSNRTAETSKKKTLYTALLVRADMRGGEAGVVWYPLYFYAGRESIHHSVVGWLQDSFGSLVCLRSLRAPTLMWAAGLWMQQPCGAAKDDDNSKEQVFMEYQLVGLSADGWQRNDRLPSNQHVKDVSKLTIELPVEEMRKIAACIVPKESAEGGSVTEGERDLLHNVLQDLVHFLTKLPHAALHLKAVNTACVSIRATGEIKVMCRRHLLGVLDFLLELHREDSLLDQVNTGSFEDLDSLRDGLDSET